MRAGAGRLVVLMCRGLPQREGNFLRYMTSLLQSAVGAGEAAEEYCMCFSSFTRREDKRLLLASKVPRCRTQNFSPSCYLCV